MLSWKFLRPITLVRAPMFLVSTFFFRKYRPNLPPKQDFCYLWYPISVPEQCSIRPYLILGSIDGEWWFYVFYVLVHLLNEPEPSGPFIHFLCFCVFCISYKMLSSLGLKFIFLKNKMLDKIFLSVIIREKIKKKIKKGHPLCFHHVNYIYLWLQV